jgi:hypothetical protein
MKKQHTHILVLTLILYILVGKQLWTSKAAVNAVMIGIMAAGLLLGLGLIYLSRTTRALLLSVSAWLAILCLMPTLILPGNMRALGVIPACAACPSGCTQGNCVCSWWVPLGGSCTPAFPWSVGCCLAYDCACDCPPANTAPSVSGSTTCSTTSSTGWCVSGATLNMSGSDPEGSTITISGTALGAPFTCAPGNTCSISLPEGNGAAVFHAYDGQLSSGDFSVPYKFDQTSPSLAPAISGTAGANGWYTSVVTVSTSASDAVSGVALAQVSGGSGWQPSLTLSDGMHNVTLAAVDNAGNEASLPQTVRVDTLPPTQLLGVTSGAQAPGGYYFSDVVVSASVGDAGSGVAGTEYQIDSGSWTGGTIVTLSTDGTHTVDFRTTDTAGLVTSGSLTLKVDKTAPVISINPTGMSGANGWYTSPVSVGIAASDPESGLGTLEYSLDGGAWVTYTGALTLTDGVHSLDVSAEDNATNLAFSALEIKVDTIAPALNLTPGGTSGSNGWYTSDVSWTAAVTDAMSGVASVEYSYDGSAWLAGLSMTSTSEGSHTLVFRVTDNAGLQVTQSRSFKLDKTDPTISITTPLEGTVIKGTANISGQAADTISGLSAAQISLDGGATWQALTLPPSGEWMHAWNSSAGGNGVYAVLARVSDDAGRTKVAQVNLVAANHPPSVRMDTSWAIWQAGDVHVSATVIPLGRVNVMIECGSLPPAHLAFSPSNPPGSLKWDRRCGNGVLAESGDVNGL